MTAPSICKKCSPPSVSPTSRRLPPPPVHASVRLKVLIFALHVHNLLHYRRTYSSLPHRCFLQLADQAGVIITVGHHSAPIYVQEGHLGSKMPLGPCPAKYMGMTMTWFRALLSVIGYPQLHPTPLYQDNISAKHLAESPSNQRRCRHIEMFEHANGQAVHDSVIKIIHQPTVDQRADILTAPLGPL